MRRKRFAIVSVALLLALAVWVAYRTERIPPSKELRPATAVATPSATIISSAATTPSSAAPVVLPDEPPANSPTVQGGVADVAAPQSSPIPPDAAALIELDKVNTMIRDFRTLAGENPVGTNAEIMAAVMGGNPKQAKLGPPEGMELNDRGELIDRWGTPYFFHQVSHDHMEIRSAGPDKVMWTADDPVIR